MNHFQKIHVKSFDIQGVHFSTFPEYHFLELTGNIFHKPQLFSLMLSLRHCNPQDTYPAVENKDGRL